MLQEGSAGSHIVGRTSDGAPIFSAERQALHDKIVLEAVEGVPASSDPTYYIMGGGPAAGKSSAINSGMVDVPKPGSGKAVEINADEVKGVLKKADDLEREDWAAFTHEESSYVAKRIQAAAIERGQDAVLDGTGDSSAASIRRKIEGARAAGYKVEGNYVTCPTDMAVDRAIERGKKPEGRVVPEDVVRGTHRDVSRVAPVVASDFDTFTLIDTSEGTPRRVASTTRGEPIKIEDQALWDAFVAKGDE
jgi:predicted ABC-type ATPase